MVENVQIINKNGDSMYAEGIAYVLNELSNKKLIVYTLNERVDNNLIKIYIAESNDQAGVSSAIPDEEWQAFRNIMLKITHNEPVENVKCMSMNGVVFNIGDPKKIALTPVAAQAFRDFQSKNIIGSGAVDTPVTNGSAPVAENVEGTPQVAEQQVVQEQPVPAQAAPVAPEQVAQPVQTPEVAPVVESPAVAQPVVAQEVPVAAPAMAPVAQEQPVPVQAVPVVPEQVAQPVQTPEVAPIVESAVVAQPVVGNPVIAPSNIAVQENQIVIEPQANVVENIKTISDEEALNAINVIQAYLDQESKLS